MKNNNTRVETGISGLSSILNGGFIPNNSYLIRGRPGSGKTTLGLHFLCAGTSAGEHSLLITLGETESRIRMNASQTAIDLSSVMVLDLSPEPDFFSKSQSYDIFTPAEVEREPLTSKITQIVQDYRPKRVFIDSITHFRYLANNEFEFRRQTISFLRYLQDNDCTVLLTSEISDSQPDDEVQFICDGVINLYINKNYNSLAVQKFRGSDFIKGNHSYNLTSGGMTVFPRLIPESFARRIIHKSYSSGIPKLDLLLGGGIEAGTISIFAGPSGAGKTTLGMQFIAALAREGIRSACYSFEEETEIMIARCESVGIPLKTNLEEGKAVLVKVEPLTLTTDEFASIVREEVENNGAALIMIDSIAGFRLAMTDGALTSNIHALCKYLQNMGVAVVLVVEQEQITGDFKVTEEGISYLADNLIFIRYLEIEGMIKKAMGVLKKRLSDFEKAVREVEITKNGLLIGEPLTNVRGILTGIPEIKKKI